METRLHAYFEKKPVVRQPGRLIDHLMQDLKLVPDPSGNKRLLLVSVLEDMSEKGELRFEKAGCVYNAVTYQSKESASSSTEVDESHLDPHPISGESMNATKMSRPERMTAALKILQRIADENGEIPGRSLLEILGAELNLPRNPVYDITRHLKALGLRRTTGSKTGVIHHIDMTTTVVTAEMLDALTITDTPEEGDDSPVLTATDETTASEAVNDEQEASPETTQPAPEPDEPAAVDWQQQVIEVIEGLRGELSTTKADLAAAEKLLEDQEKLLQDGATKFGDVAAKLTSAEEECNRLRSENAQLRAGQKPIDRLAALLEEHRKPSEDAS